MEFPLLGKKIEISDGRKNYMAVLTFYRAMGEQAKQSLAQEYEDSFGLVFLNSTYAERLKKTFGSEGYMDNIVMRYVTKTRQYLASYGVYNLTDSKIWDQAIVSDSHYASQLQEALDSFLMYGVEHDYDDDQFVSYLKNKLSGNYLPECLYNDIMSLCDFVINYLDENNIAEIQHIFKQDASDASAIYKNLIDGNVPIQEQKGLAYSLIELDPRNPLYFEYIYNHFPEGKYDISRIAIYLHIDLSDYIEKDIKRQFDLKTITSEADALKMMDELNDVMEHYGVSQSSRKTELEKILHDFDVKARTYNEIIFDSRELRNQAERDENRLNDLHGDISVLDKATCTELISKIKPGLYVGQIKDKHLQALSNRILTIDRNYLDGLLKNLDSMDEASCEQSKEVILAYDAPSNTKQPFIDRVDKRIQLIWEAEDFTQFSDLFAHTSVGDSAQISKAVAFIRENGRTGVKEDFIKALSLLNDSNVVAAAKYAVAKESGTIASILNMGKKDVYESLTLNGRVIHPAILTAMEESKSKKGGGLFGGFKRGKASSAPIGQPSASDTSNFCPACGAKLESDAQFCTQCGTKIH